MQSLSLRCACLSTLVLEECEELTHALVTEVGVKSLALGEEECGKV